MPLGEKSRKSYRESLNLNFLYILCISATMTNPKVFDTSDLLGFLDPTV